MTLLSFFVVETMSILATGLAVYILIAYGVLQDLVPLRMRLIYRMTREWLAKVGWGESTKAEREEYPNRREDS